MNVIAHTVQSSFRALAVSTLILPSLCGWAMNNGEKLEELRERSKRILATLDGLDSRLEQMRSANSEQSTPVNEVGPRDQKVIWEDYESIPLPGDSEDKETPQTVEEHTESGTIEWETYSENENESPQESSMEQDTEFEFVIEKYEEENPEISDDPDSFNSSDSTYRVVKSDYYVIFNYGIQLGSEIDFSSDLPALSGELDVDWGHNLSLELGIPLDMMANLELGILLGFNNAEISGFSGSSKTATALTGADGEISNYYFAIRPNYTFELSDEMAIRAGTSLGLSSRHNHFDSEHVNTRVIPGANNYIFQEEKLCILWDFHTTVQWALWENGGLLFGYRFAYVTGTGDFEGHFGNSLEFGGRWGF